MKIKRILASFLAMLLMGACLASCAEGTDGVTPPSTTQESTEAETVAPKPAAPVDLESTVNTSLGAAIDAHESELSWTVGENGAILTKYNGSAKKVKIPQTLGGVSVTAIGEGAFAENKTLEALVLPDSVTAIGKGILAGCDALVALHTPLLGASAEGTQFLGYLFGADKHENNSRDVPPSLQILSIGKGLTALPAFSLFECNGLVAIRLDESIKSLGTYALYRCEKLQSVNLSHLETVADHALDQCTSLTHITFGTNLTSVGLGALEGCASVKSLTLPFVGGSQTDATYLAYVFGATVPDFAKGYYPRGLVEINLLTTCQSLGNYAFYELETLVYLTVPEGVTTIGTRAFDGCIRLRSMALPNSLESIGDNAFFGCFRLESVTFGEQNTSRLTQIGINAFYGCSALEGIVLPHALKELPASCFADCKALKSIDLGGVTKVGKNAFHNCEALETIKENLPVQYEDK